MNQAPLTETCCQCGRVRRPGDWRWDWLQVIPLNFKVGVGLKPLCPVCSERINAQHLADQIGRIGRNDGMGQRPHYFLGKTHYHF